MELTDINDAYAVRINPMGMAHDGGASSLLSPPAVQSNPNPVVMLPPMSSPPSTVPTYPESIVTDALRTQHASSSHTPYKPRPAAYISTGDMEPPEDAEPGYFERMGMRQRDAFKLVVLSVMVALGISIHWVGSHYISEWIESSNFSARQRLAVRVAYPLGIAFLLWNLKAFQQ